MSVAGLGGKKKGKEGTDGETEVGRRGALFACPYCFQGVYAKVIRVG